MQDFPLKAGTAAAGTPAGEAAAAASSPFERDLVRYTSSLLEHGGPAADSCGVWPAETLGGPCFRGSLAAQLARYDYSRAYVLGSCCDGTSYIPPKNRSQEKLFRTFVCPQ